MVGYKTRTQVCRHEKREWKIREVKWSERLVMVTEIVVGTFHWRASIRKRVLVYFVCVYFKAVLQNIVLPNVMLYTYTSVSLFLFCIQKDKFILSYAALDTSWKKPNKNKKIGAQVKQE